MELREIRLILGRHIGLMLVVFYGVVGSASFAAYAPEQIYRANTTVILNIKTVTRGSRQRPTGWFPAPGTRRVGRESDAAGLVPLSGCRRRWRRNARGSRRGRGQRVAHSRANSPSPEAAQAWANAVAEQLVVERADDPLLELVQLDSARSAP